MAQTRPTKADTSDQMLPALYRDWVDLISYELPHIEGESVIESDARLAPIGDRVTSLERQILNFTPTSGSDVIGMLQVLGEFANLEGIEWTAIRSIQAFLAGKRVLEWSPASARPNRRGRIDPAMMHPASRRRVKSSQATSMEGAA